MAQLFRKLKRAFLNSDPSFCDMHEDAHARQAAAEYLGYIRDYLRRAYGDRKLTILDAGCQAGRLLIPLAEDGHRLIGVDTSAFALRRTAQHARERKLAVQLHTGNISSIRRWVKPGSVDAVICAEVLYLCKDYQALLKLLADSLKPGGLILASHRPNIFYVATARRRGDEAMAASVLRTSEGPSPDGAYHNWQTEKQLKELYASLGLTLLACAPVDHALFPVNPAAADPDVARLLDTVSREGAALRVPQYFLVVASKNE